MLSNVKVWMVCNGGVNLVKPSMKLQPYMFTNAHIILKYTLRFTKIKLSNVVFFM